MKRFTRPAVWVVKAELGVRTLFVLTPLCMLAAIAVSARLLDATDFRVPVKPI